jgi:hypothetical protein
MHVILLISSFVFIALLPALQGYAQDRPASSAPPQSDLPAAASPPSLHDRLLARFAELSVAAGEAEDAARAYEAGSGSKSIAVAIKARHTWHATGRPTQEAAVRSAQEGCQVFYGEPCVLAAVGDKVETKPPQDMPRTRYSGRFEPERVPSVRDNIFQRADVTTYRSISGAKAAAYHPLGWLFIVTGASGQFEAEEQVLAACNDDPRGKAEPQEGPCFLYAAGDRVVLPQRLTAPRPRPQTVSEAFAYLGMSPFVALYAGGKGYKAVAVAPERGDPYLWFRAVSAAAAEERALEGCQLQYRTHCVLLASDDELRAPDLWKADRRNMPRLDYNGVYAPEQVPLFSGTEEALTSYASLAAPKAMVIRPKGTRVRTATGASPAEAQSKALAACNDDLDFMPCFVYAVDERVVIDQRRTEPAE